MLTYVGETGITGTVKVIWRERVIIVESESLLREVYGRYDLPKIGDKLEEFTVEKCLGVRNMCVEFSLVSQVKNQIRAYPLSSIDHPLYESYLVRLRDCGIVDHEDPKELTKLWRLYIGSIFDFRKLAKESTHLEFS